MLSQQAALVSLHKLLASKPLAFTPQISRRLRRKQSNLQFGKGRQGRVRRSRARRVSVQIVSASSRQQHDINKDVDRFPGPHRTSHLCGHIRRREELWSRLSEPEHHRSARPLHLSANQSCPTSHNARPTGLRARPPNLTESYRVTNSQNLAEGPLNEAVESPSPLAMFRL
jgi:hypothetical protein